LAGKFGFFLRSAYAASKHALHGFYEALRLEQEKNNVQVTIVCPAFVKTAISINAIDKTGKKMDIMDNNQEKGMSADRCALEIYKAIEKNKKEALIGNGEQKIVNIKRFFPSLFYKIIRKQNPT
jgi:short-subunit dehydrogenase